MPLSNLLGFKHPLEGAGMHVYIYRDYTYTHIFSYYNIYFIILYYHCFSLLLLVSLHASNSPDAVVPCHLVYVFWLISNESFFNLWFVHRYGWDSGTSNFEQC